MKNIKEPTRCPHTQTQTQTHMHVHVQMQVCGRAGGTTVPGPEGEDSIPEVRTRREQEDLLGIWNTLQRLLQNDPDYKTLQTQICPQYCNFFSWKSTFDHLGGGAGDSTCDNGPK